MATARFTLESCDIVHLDERSEVPFGCPKSTEHLRLYIARISNALPVGLMLDPLTSRVIVPSSLDSANCQGQAEERASNSTNLVLSPRRTTQQRHQSSVWTGDVDFGPVDDFARRDPPIEFPWALFEDCGFSEFDYGLSSSVSSSREGQLCIGPDWGYRTVGPADFCRRAPAFFAVHHHLESSEGAEEEGTQVEWSGSSDGEDADREWREFDAAFDGLDAPM
ncbi:hypothetical protein JCM10295v2_001649 [Rhodotorula toruloides]